MREGGKRKGEGFGGRSAELLNCKSALKWQSTQSWAFTHSLLTVAFAKFTQQVSRNAMTKRRFERLAANCGQPRIDQDEYIKPQSVTCIIP